MHEASRAGRIRFLERMLTAFPSSAPSGYPLSPVRTPEGEESRDQRPDRPRLALRRHPAKSGAILQTRVPSTITFERDEEGSLPPALTSASRSRRPHVFPGMGKTC
jgi:hypothetical protein